jgi:peptide/nickel transport system permease protein
MAIFADIIAPYGYEERSDNCGVKYPYCSYAPPSWDHPFGTNLIGRDVFSRVIYGSRIALQLSFFATILSLGIGLPFGILSGYYGGKIDRLLNLIADSLYSFPSLLLAIAVAIALGQFGDLKTILAVAIATSVVYAPLYFKVVRAQVLSIKSEAYVEAAKSMGANSMTILARYIIPNVVAASIALIPFNMTEAILVNAGLAFLGLGIQPPTADWGYDVFKNKSIVRVREQTWAIAFPGVFIFLLSFAFALIGDTLNDKFNPLLEERD